MICSVLQILCAVAALDAAPLAAKTVSSADLDANKDVLDTTPSAATETLLVTKATKIKKVDPKVIHSAMKDFPAKKVSALPAKTTSSAVTTEAPTATPAVDEATKASVLLPDLSELESPAAPLEAIPEPSAVIGWSSEVLKARLESPFAKPLFEDHKAQSFVHSALSGYTYFF